MTKVYIEKQGAPELPMSLVFWPNFKFPISPKRLFLREIMEQYQEPFFRIVERLEEADFFVVPYEYFFAEDACPEYLARVFALAKAARKKVLLFDYTDYVDRETMIPPHGILFRISAYRHHKRQNEIIMPYFVEDMGMRYGIVPKEKGDEPIVGYCGQSQFGSRVKELRAHIRWLAHAATLVLCGDTDYAVHRRGIFWRQEVIRALRRSGISCRIIERPFYSGHRASMTCDEELNRREYAENLRDADLALCTRGDSNQSQRFFETLSASRIPFFLDTDCVLPLEEVLPYDDFMVRVSVGELGRLSERVRSWEAVQAPASFLEKGRSASRAYEAYLRIDRFFALVFDREKSPYRKLLYKTNSSIRMDS